MYPHVYSLNCSILQSPRGSQLTEVHTMGADSAESQAFYLGTLFGVGNVSVVSQE
jgi:hypothetical protein